MTTYTAEQIEAIGGRRWTSRDGTITRVYLNDWHKFIGLEIDHYKSGNISSAALNGQPISNARASRLASAKVHWEAGTIRSDLLAAAESARQDGDALVQQLADSIAAAVAETERDDDSSTGTPASPAEQVNALRAAGRTVGEIAQMIGVAVSTIYRWARGICRPRPTNAAALAALI